MRQFGCTVTKFKHEYIDIKPSLKQLFQVVQWMGGWKVLCFEFLPVQCYASTGICYGISVCLCVCLCITRVLC